MRNLLVEVFQRQPDPSQEKQEKGPIDDPVEIVKGHVPRQEGVLGDVDAERKGNNTRWVRLLKGGYYYRENTLRVVRLCPPKLFPLRNNVLGLGEGLASTTAQGLAERERTSGHGGSRIVSS